MSSIPLVALQVKPVEQPDVVGNLTRIQQLRGLQQQQQQSAAMAPIQQQLGQQAVQGGQLELQQKQQALKDQQAMTASMQQWDGKSIDDLAPLVIKNGGSASAVMGLKAKSLEMKAQYSKIAADDATTGSKQIDTLMQKNDLVAGAMGTVLQQPDDQLPQALTTTAQQLAQQGLLDPQHVQMAQQLAQQAAQHPDALAQVRQQLDIMRKGMLSNTQLLDDAQKEATTAASKATTGKTNAELNYYAQNGGAPGVPVEAQELNSYLRTHPGSNAADFAAWKAKQSPMAIVMGNQLGGQQNSDALDFAAENYRQTGQMPPGLFRSPGTITAIISRAAQLDQEAGGQGVAVNKTILNANKTSLASLQKNFDQVEAFTGTAQRNMDLVEQTANNIPDLGTKFANVPARMISANMIGTTNKAKFHTALYAAQTEAAKVLTSANASGVLSDSARHELQTVIDGNAPLPAILGSLNTLKQEFSNRTQSYQMQIKDIQGRLNQSGSGAQGGAQPNSNDPFAQFGGKAH